MCRCGRELMQDPLFGGFGDGVAGTMMVVAHTQEEAALPLLVRVKNPVWTVDSSYPPAATLQRTSSEEQLLRMYSGNSLLQPAPRAAAAFPSSTAPVNSEHTEPLYSPWTLIEEGPVEDGARLSYAGFWKLSDIPLVIHFLQHTKPQICGLNRQK